MGKMLVIKGTSFDTYKIINDLTYSNLIDTSMSYWGNSKVYYFGPSYLAKSNYLFIKGKIYLKYINGYSGDIYVYAYLTNSKSLIQFDTIKNNRITKNGFYEFSNSNRIFFNEPYLILFKSSNTNVDGSPLSHHMVRPTDFRNGIFTLDSSLSTDRHIFESSSYYMSDNWTASFEYTFKVY